MTDRPPSEPSELTTVERVLPRAFGGTPRTETAASSTADAPAPAAAGPAPTTWRDRLVLGDAVALLDALGAPARRAEVVAAGGLRLVYLDPPFATGGSFAMDVPIGDGGSDGRGRTVRLPAYRDAWGGGLAGYLSAMAPLLRRVHALLADDGSLFVHCDHRASAALRLLLDEVFGPGRLVNELVWTYGLGNAGGPRAFARKHDTLLFYARGPRYRFNRPRGAVTAAMLAKYRHVAPDGTRTMRSYGKTYALKGGKPIGSVWDDIPALAPTDRERVGYPTQKPEALLERIILAATDPGDLVADLGCGSGTTPAVAARLGRRWLAADSSPLAVATTRSRLLALGRRQAAAGEAPPGFEVAELDAAGFDAEELDPADPRAAGRGAPPGDGRTGQGVPGEWAGRPGTLPGYRLRVSAAAERRGGTVVVRLLGVAAVTVPGDPSAADVVAGPRPGRSALVVEGSCLVRLARDRAGELTRQPITHGWADWVDGWAVDPGTADPGTADPGTADPPPGGVFRTAWETTRTGRDRRLDLASPPVPAAAGGTVRVRVFDPLGGRWDTICRIS